MGLFMHITHKHQYPVTLL